VFECAVYIVHIKLYLIIKKKKVKRSFLSYISDFYSPIILNTSVHLTTMINNSNDTESDCFDVLKKFQERSNCQLAYMEETNLFTAEQIE
jgi:hypothetical protein